jgi:hypothetical protein
MLARIRERKAAEDRNAVVHPLTVKLAVLVPVSLEHLGWEDPVDDLGFLQAQNVRLLLHDEPLHEGGTRANRIDVP